MWIKFRKYSPFSQNTALGIYLIFLGFPNSQLLTRLFCSFEPHSKHEEKKDSFFKLGNHSFEGDFLIFNYSVKFPGVTRIILLNPEGNRIWADQYVDDKPGEHRFLFNSTKLKTGDTYIFKFEFKDETALKAVTIP